MYDVLKQCSFQSGIYRYRNEPEKLYRAQLGVCTTNHEIDGRLQPCVIYWQHGDRAGIKEADAPPYSKAYGQFVMNFEFVRLLTE